MLLVGCGPKPAATVAPSDSNTSTDGTTAVATDSGTTSSAPADTAYSRKSATPGIKELRYPVPSDGPRSMDPVDGSTLYDNWCVSQVYETLLQTKYLVRPYESEPLLLEKMPEVSEDRLTYHFTLKEGVKFHDDPCFPDGKGREITSADVIYSFKRIADSNVSLKSWWLLENSMVGFDE